eukprot:7984-Chlamydomonas_euryale.AAC.2
MHGHVFTWDITFWAVGSAREGNLRARPGFACLRLADVVKPQLSPGLGNVYVIAATIFVFRRART